MPDPVFESAAAAAPQGIRRMAAAQKKEFPPAISRPAWEMKKYWTGDGRLIIRVERVSHEYFLADRSDGRLVLILVHVDEDDFEEEEIKRDRTVEEVAAEYYKYNNGL